MKKGIVAILLTTAMVLTMAGCAAKEKAAPAATQAAPAATQAAVKADAPAAKSLSDIKICYTIKGKNAWLEQQAIGCIEACAELGIPEPTIVYNEDQTDAAAQSQAIEDMIALEPDAIIIDPTQAPVVAGALKKAVDKGIIVIETDTCGGLDMVTVSIGLDEYNAAYEQATTLCKALKKGDKVVIVAGAQGDANGESRLAGQKAACADNGIEVLDAQYADWSADNAASVMEDLITRFSGDFQGVLTPSDDMTVACVTALKQANMIDNVLVAGYGGFQIAVDEIKKGTMFMTVGMKPYQCGYQAVQVVKDIIMDNKYPTVDFIDVGAEMVTAENVDSWKGF